MIYTLITGKDGIVMVHRVKNDSGVSDGYIVATSEGKNWYFPSSFCYRLVQL